MKHLILTLTLALTALGAAMVVQAAKHPNSASTAAAVSNNANAVSYLGGVGQIVAVDIQSKTIQIGQTVYGIADGVQIVNHDNNLLSQLALAPGENIEFNLEKQPLSTADNSPLPAQVMTHIRIINGFNNDKILK